MSAIIRISCAVPVFAALMSYQAAACDWQAQLGTPGFNGQVLALERFDDGGGLAIFAGGEFTQAGEAAASYVAKWNGNAWQQVGQLDGPVHALAVFDDGSGPALFAGGQFASASGQPAKGIAKWNGKSWSSVGGGMGGGIGHAVNALAVFDDGDGPALYAGGEFTLAGELPAFFIAKWNGSQWSNVGGGLDDQVNALTVCTLQGQTRLYATGKFTTADPGGTELGVSRIASFDGKAWHKLAGGIQGTGLALCSSNGKGPGGTALYVGGLFSSVGGSQSTAAAGVARWNGESWSAVGEGLGGSAAPCAHALTIFDDHTGSGPALFVGGAFAAAGGKAAANIAKWNGTEWLNVGDGVNAPVRAILSDERSEPTLSAVHVGGTFSSAGDQRVGHIASIPACADKKQRLGDLNHDGVVNVDDLIALLAVWGACPSGGGGGTGGGFTCAGDIAPPAGDGIVNVDDLIALLANWG